MAPENRSDYRTVAQGAEVYYRCERPTPYERSYLIGLAENLSLGGLFVSVRQPPLPGTVVRLRLYGADDRDHTTPLCATALVRWRRLWGKPRGMGLQFLEFEGLGERRLDTWLAAIAAAETVPDEPSRPSQPAVA
jgi:PilZ domain